MSGKRSGDKKNFGGWILASLYDRVAAFAAKAGKTNTDVLAESLTEYLDRHEPATGEAAISELEK